MNAPEHIDIPAIDASAAPLASGKNATADCIAAAIPAGGRGPALPNAVAKATREVETRVAIRQSTDDVTIGELNESKRLKTQVDMHSEHGILGQMLWTINQMQASMNRMQASMVLPIAHTSNNEKRTWNASHPNQLRALQVEHAPNAPNHAQIGSEPGGQPASIADIFEMDDNQLEAWETAFNHTVGGATTLVKRQSLMSFYVLPGFY